MTNLTRWERFPTMRDLVERMSLDRPSLLRGQPSMEDFPVEISETDSAIQVKASLPGVASEDIDISVHANSLTIRAESKEEAEEKGKNYLRREIGYGSMQRSFALPTEVDPDKADATFVNGVLRLSLPKVAPSTAKQIKVK